MSSDGDRISAPPRALRRLVEELRGDEPPPVDWSAVEERLMAELDREALLREALLREAVEREAVDREIRVADRIERERSSPGAAEILVPWDDDPAADEPLEAGPAEPGDEDGARDEGAPSEPGALRQAPGREPAPSRRRAAAATPSRGGGRARWVAGAAVAAMAAAAAFALAPRASTPDRGAFEPVDLEMVAVAPRLGDTLDLASLRAGDVVEAVEGPVTFGREGVLSWTLSAGGRVRVVAGLGRGAAGHVVSLESGALDVEVVPLSDAGSAREQAGSVAARDDGEKAAQRGLGERPAVERLADESSGAAAHGERFVVEVAEARVAVHGTAFRVVRSTRSVVVEVSRGVVSVGPRAGGAGSGRRLEAPQRASIGLDGEGFRELPARGTVATRAAGSAVVDRSSVDERYAGAQIIGSSRGEAPGSPVGLPAMGLPAAGAPMGAAAPRVASSADGVVVPAAPPEAAPPWSKDRVRTELVSCIRRSGASSAEQTWVTVGSRLVVDVDAEGRARSVRFEPPIRPDLQACAQPVFGARFEATPHQLVVPFEVRLGQHGAPR